MQMPTLDSKMHVEMLQSARAAGQIGRDDIYGLTWGDPQTLPALRRIRDHFLLPYVNPDHTAIEIGPGGGRWTRYLLGFGHLYGVDYHPELLEELAGNFKAPHLHLILNNGTDFPGIPDLSVDFLFSFGVFVHLDVEIITAYLKNLRRVLKPTGCATIQYSDKTKAAARKIGESFADTTPEILRALVISSGYRVLEEDLTTLWHSSVIRFAASPAE
jgi:ubiquinone/menaquinone biosynthesis C-methylase UbiE